MPSHPEGWGLPLLPHASLKNHLRGGVSEGQQHHFCLSLQKCSLEQAGTWAHVPSPAVNTPPRALKALNSTELHSENPGAAAGRGACGCGRDGPNPPVPRCPVPFDPSRSRRPLLSPGFAKPVAVPARSGTAGGAAEPRLRGGAGGASGQWGFRPVRAAPGPGTWGPSGGLTFGHGACAGVCCCLSRCCPPARPRRSSPPLVPFIRRRAHPRGRDGGGKENENSFQETEWFRSHLFKTTTQKKKCRRGCCSPQKRRDRPPEPPPGRG